MKNEKKPTLEISVSLPVEGLVDSQLIESLRGRFQLAVDELFGCGEVTPDHARYDNTVVSKGEVVVGFSECAELDAGGNPASFKLIDEGMEGDGDVIGHINNDSCLGLGIHINEYGEYSCADDKSYPLYLYKDSGKLKLLVYGDINTENPTHSIDLQGSHISNRKK